MESDVPQHSNLPLTVCEEEFSEALSENAHPPFPRHFPLLGTHCDLDFREIDLLEATSIWLD